jgi:peptidoglycan/LPS O-acetylase OafA/YrhL
MINGQMLASLYVGMAWSISAEVMLYLLYIPFCRAICALHSSRTILIALSVFVVITTGFNLGRTGGFWMRNGWDQYYDFYQSPYCRFSEFMLGALVAALYQKRASCSTVWAEGRPLLAASLIGMAALFAATYSRYGHLFRLFEYSWGFAPSCAGLIYYFCSQSWPRLLARRKQTDRPLRRCEL